MEGHVPRPRRLQHGRGQGQGRDLHQQPRGLLHRWPHGGARRGRQDARQWGDVQGEGCRESEGQSERFRGEKGPSFSCTHPSSSNQHILTFLALVFRLLLNPLQVKEYIPEFQAHTWAVLSHHSPARYDQLSALQKSVQAVNGQPWVKTFYLAEYAEWLISSGLNDSETVEDCLLTAADTIMEFDMGEGARSFLFSFS